MRSNVKLGRVSGIEIGLHYSWFIITALIVFSLGQRFHQMNQSWSASEVWITAFLTAALFFVSLLLHELAHSLVARKRGLKVRSGTRARPHELREFADPWCLCKVRARAF